MNEDEKAEETLEGVGNGDLEKEEKENGKLKYSSSNDASESTDGADYVSLFHNYFEVRK